MLNFYLAMKSHQDQHFAFKATISQKIGNYAFENVQNLTFYSFSFSAHLDKLLQRYFLCLSIKLNLFWPLLSEFHNPSRC